MLSGRRPSGVLTVTLYLPGDMWPNRDGSESEPEWVATERQQFANVRDHDNDGVMNRDEVRDWIIPADYDHSEAEAKHLIYESDKDLVCCRQVAPPHVRRAPPDVVTRHRPHGHLAVHPTRFTPLTSCQRVSHATSILTLRC